MSYICHDDKLYCRLPSGRLMTYHAAWKADQGLDFHVEASQVKLHADEMYMRVVDRAIQIHGGLGLSRELPLELMFRDARSRLITEGSSEMQRIIIASDLLAAIPAGGDAYFLRLRFKQAINADWQAFARIGLLPDGGSTWFLPRLVGPSQAAEWIYTGRVFPAAEALASGLATLLSWLGLTQP